MSPANHRHRHPKTAPFFLPKTTPFFLPKTTPFFLPLSLPSPDQTQTDSGSARPSVRTGSAESGSGSGLPSMVRIGGLNQSGKAGGPAFVGQVFSMCDLTGTGLMAVSTHFDIPFLSKRTPEWIKKVFSSVIRSDRGPVFRFFMDLGDAVSYVKRLNIPSGIVGACRLDSAYEHFKEKPHLFQFVPNEKQVKEANKLLNRGHRSGERKRIDGVPVFSAQNLDIAIATTDGIKWYTPYFFDKSILDNILEESVDQHFHSLIQSRHLQRRRDVVDDSIAAEVIEETADNMWEPAEMQELMDEMGNHGIPLSVISKAAEIQLLHAVDWVLLGNRWLRKATGIQPKFPYMVDSFERRSAASYSRASGSATRLATSYDQLLERPGSSTLETVNNSEGVSCYQQDFRFPFGDWSKHPWARKHEESGSGLDTRPLRSSEADMKEKPQMYPFLPRVTMVGIATNDSSQMSKSTLKKTMEELTKELEQDGHENATNNASSDKFNPEDRDPLFVANVGDYYSNMAKSGRWVRGMNS